MQKFLYSLNKSRSKICKNELHSGLSSRKTDASGKVCYMMATLSALMPLISFHSHYNEQFYTAHPSIYIFIDVIKQIQSTTYIKIHGLDTPAILRRSEKKKVVYARQQYAKLESGEITRSTYIKSIGFKFAARTNL